MSKIGKLPVILPNNTEVKVEDKKVIVKGPKGSLDLKLPQNIEVEITENQVVVKVKKVTLQSKADYGTIRSLIANMVNGVNEGWTKKMELIGTGYRAEVNGNDLILTVGYSHPIKINAPEGISFKVEKNVVTVSGTDRIVVGQTAASIRAVRPPEPYKGKGIKYVDEVIRRKAGKAAKAGSA
jgi:large subunit ribosomal protein L6